jgi:hypothetical protein
MKMLVCFTAIWYILLPIGKNVCLFGTFFGHWVYFPPFLVFCTEKNLATLKKSIIFAETCCVIY